MTLDIPIVAFSLQDAFEATGVTLPIGLITAWLLVRKDFRGKFALDVGKRNKKNNRKPTKSLSTSEWEAKKQARKKKGKK